MRRWLTALYVGVGLVATGLSMFYTTQWLLYVGEHIVIALLMAGLITVMMVTSLEVAMYLTMLRQRWLFAVVLFALYGGLALYSMSATVAAQYIGVLEETAKREESYSEAVAVQKEAELAGERLAELERDRSALVKNRDALGAIGGDARTSLQEIAEYRTTYRAVVAERERIASEIRRIDEESRIIRSTLSDLHVRDVEVAKRDIFLYYERIFKVQSGTIQFTLAVFRAVALDAINVIAFWLVISGVLKLKAKVKLLTYAEAAHEIADRVASGNPSTADLHADPAHVRRIKALLEAKRVMKGGTIVAPAKAHEALHIRGNQ